MKLRYLIHVWSVLFAAIITVSLSASCTSSQGAGATTASKPAKRPNIVLIMSDDMGYSDLGCYGGEINTPQLDKLAQEGVRFTQFYNAARCCPTRASLISGLYPHDTGIGHMTNPPKADQQHDYNLPGYRGFLNKECATMAEVLKGAGYQTYMSGKWHLGVQKQELWPNQRGFDQFYGILAGATNYFKPVEPRQIYEQNESIEVTDPEYYTTDAFTDKAIEFINKGDEDKPFFLYLAYNAPHWPLQAPKEEIDKYRSTYKEGWEKVREDRFARMKALGILDASWELTEADAPEWSSLPEEKREEMALRRAIYAAQVDRMDQNIGRLVKYLMDKNELDNTLFVFLNDNGACAEGGTLGGGNKDLLETEEGLWLTYGQAWANSSNTPFRRYKHWVHEGGISSPLIIRWPGMAAQYQGKFIREHSFLPDLMATFIDVAQADYPPKGMQNIKPLVGKSLIPVLKGKDEPVHTEPIFWEHEGNKAVRLGKYKLVMQWKDKKKNHWELYDMEKDRTETHDLSSQNPDKVKEMSDLWQQWADNHQVKPWNEIQNIMSAKHK